MLILVFVFHYTYYGDEDRLVHLRFGEHLAKHIPNGELHVLAGQGYLFTWDHQDMIFQAVLSEWEEG